MSLDTILTDAVINAVAQKVSEKIQVSSQAQWKALLTELANSRQVIERVTKKLEELETLTRQQTHLLTTNQQEKQRLHQASNEALTILQNAKKELGLE